MAMCQIGGKLLHGLVMILFTEAYLCMTKPKEVKNYGRNANKYLLFLKKL